MECRMADATYVGRKDITIAGVTKNYPLARMTIFANGTVAEARTSGAIHDKMLFDTAIAQGSAFVNTKTFKVDLYDEENDKFGSEA